MPRLPFVATAVLALSFVAAPAVSQAQTASVEATAPPSGQARLRGARLVYVGAEGALLLGKSTPHEQAGMLGLDPNVEFHFTPQWSVQAHVLFAAGLGGDQPKSWWEIGVRGFWRPQFLPAQNIGLGIGLGQPRETRSGRSQAEPVTPHFDAELGIWEFDFDPVRFGPAVNFGVNFKGSYFLGLGVAGQFGFGPIRTTTR